MLDNGPMKQIAVHTHLDLNGSLEHCSKLDSVTVIIRDHSFPRQIFPNSAGHFAKFRGSQRQIYHI